MELENMNFGDGAPSVDIESSEMSLSFSFKYAEFQQLGQQNVQSYRVYRHRQGHSPHQQASTACTSAMRLV